MFVPVPAAVGYEDTVGLRTQRRVTIVSEQVIKEKEVTIEKKEVTEEEMEKILLVPEDVDESWFILFDPAPLALRSFPTGNNN